MSFSTANKQSCSPLRADEHHHEADDKVETNPELYQRFNDLVSSMPRLEARLAQIELCRHDDGWYSPPTAIVGSMVADACFAARATDIVVATHPKCGTTWVKALLYATVHRAAHPPDAADHPFHSRGPHECVRFLEMQHYTRGRVPDLGRLPDPRLLATHVPFASLPRTVTAPGTSSRIVYMCRDPKDTFVSLLALVNKYRAQDGAAEPPLAVEAAAELFCGGAYAFGPYWDHVLGYWRAHLARPDRVLFLRYEEVQRDPAAHVRRLAEFAGCPFGAGEEEDRAVDAVVGLCSFDNMVGLEATRHGTTNFEFRAVENSDYFRRGVVGDWVNHLSPETARRIDAITAAKFEGSGLRF